MAATRRQIIFAILVSSLFWVRPLVSLAGTFRDNFEDGDLVGWKPNIANGISVVDGKLRFNCPDSLVVKLGNPSWQGYSLKARVKIVEFTNGGWFSIRILQGNTQGRSGYYEIRLAQSGIVAALYVNNSCVESFRVLAVVEENVWHQVRVSPSNGEVSLYLDGVLMAQLTHLGLSGYIDMCSTKGTYVYVDDVAISGPNIPNTGPSGPNSFAVKPQLRLAIAWGHVRWNSSLD